MKDTLPLFMHCSAFWSSLLPPVRDEDLNRIERLEQRIEELTNPKLSEDKIDVASGGSNFWEPKLSSPKKDWTSGGSKKQEISDPYAPNKRKVFDCVSAAFGRNFYGKMLG